MDLNRSWLYSCLKFPTDFVSLIFFFLGCFENCHTNLLLTDKYIINKVWQSNRWWFGLLFQCFWSSIKNLIKAISRCNMTKNLLNFQNWWSWPRCSKRIFTKVNWEHFCGWRTQLIDTEGQIKFYISNIIAY